MTANFCTQASRQAWDGRQEMMRSQTCHKDAERCDGHHEPRPGRQPASFGGPLNVHCAGVPQGSRLLQRGQTCMHATWLAHGMLDVKPVQEEQGDGAAWTENCSARSTQKDL